MTKKIPLSYFFGKMSKENARGLNRMFQCMGCAFKLEAEEAPEECPRCKSQLSFSQVKDWRFF